MVLNKGETLKPESRVNYGKLYTVEHNAKVCFIGEIHAKFITTFNRVYKEKDMNSEALPREAVDAIIGVAAGVAGAVLGTLGTLIFIVARASLGT